MMHEFFPWQQRKKKIWLLKNIGFIHVTVLPMHGVEYRAKTPIHHIQWLF